MLNIISIIEGGKLDEFDYIVIAIILIVIISKIIKSKKNIKMRKGKQDLIENNEFIKNNRYELEKLVEENSEYRAVFAKEMSLVVILFVISLIFIIYGFFVNTGIQFIIGGMGFFVTGIFMFIINRKYKSGFKEKVVTQIIKKYNPKFNYQPHSGFSKSEYDMCMFPEDCDIFSSEDLITNDEVGFKYADVLVQSEHEDSEGNTHTVTEYQGSLARIAIKDCKCEIFLGGMKKYLFAKENHQKIKFENDEFNKLFSAYTNNELISYKILTPDVMEQFVHLKKNAYGDIDIRIIGDRLYIRFLSGDGFSPNIFNKKSEINSIIASIAVLEEVINTMNKVRDIINEKDI